MFSRLLTEEFNNDIEVVLAKVSLFTILVIYSLLSNPDKSIMNTSIQKDIIITSYEKGPP